MTTWEGIKLKYKTLNIAEKLITINVVIYILLFFVESILFLFVVPFSAFLNWFSLSSSFSVFLMEPWSILTYGFLHSGLWHLITNMLVLYFASTIMLNLFNKHFFLKTYLIGILFGGIVFMVSHALFPVFSGMGSILVGSSAGVMAVFIFVCTYSPFKQVQILFFKVKLYHLGIAFVVIDIIQLPNGNAGGNFAHIGGALWGYFYAKQLLKGKDFGSVYDAFENWFSDWFSSKPKAVRYQTVKKKKRKTKSKSTKKASFTSSEEQKIDAILDKISASGYSSLSDAEKEYLFKVSKK